MANKQIDCVCAVRDTLIGAYLPPFLSDTTSRAIRDFSDVCLNKESPIAKHSSDYTLEHIGYFNRETGDFLPLLPEDKRVLAHANDFIKA